MRDSLNRGTAQLPADAGEYAVFPARTVDAIASGAIEACAGAIERMHARLSSRAGEAPRGIASGGALELLAPRLSFPLTINDNLVLDGLLAIARSTE
jgi:type III pantothenate kinase